MLTVTLFCKIAAV